MRISEAYFLQIIAAEKEKQLKEVMKIMGLQNWLHWMAWFVMSFMTMGISLILVTIALVVTKSLQTNIAVCQLTTFSYRPK